MPVDEEAVDDGEKVLVFAEPHPDGATAVVIAPGLVAQSPTIAWSPLRGYHVELELVVVPMTEGRAGRFVCRSVKVTQFGQGPMVTTDALRSVPITRLIHETAVGAVQSVGPDGEATWLTGMSAERLAAMRADPTSSQTLTTVAAVYRRALIFGHAPSVAVEEFFDVSRRTAGRYTATARAHGHLGPVEGPGLAGG